MATSVGQVALDIVMGKNTVAGVVGSAMADVQKIMNDSSASVSQKVSAIGDATQKVGGAIMPISTAVVGLGTAAVKTSADFDSSMSNVAAISGATGDDLQALRDKAKEMGETTKFSASQSADAMSYMAMAGWKTEDMLNGISGVMNLAAASGEDLATTSDIVTDALTAFGMTAQDSDHFADILAAASSNANTNVSMMGETFKYCAPLCGSMGYSAEDASIAIGLMANAGIKGSQAGTTLKNAIANMVKPTDKQAAVMERLGISLTDAQGNMLPLRDVLGQLRTSFGECDADAQAYYATTLFGKESMAGMLAIVNASDGDYQKLAGAIDNCDGSAQNMADTMNDNLNGQITLLKSALEGLAISFGETLMPTIKEVVTHVQGLVDKLNAMPQSQRDIIVKIGLAVAAAGPLLVIVGKLTTGIGGVIGVFSKFSGVATSVTSSAAGAAGGMGAIAKQGISLIAAGAGILLAAAGIALLAYSAIQLAQAGPSAAIAMGALVVALAGLAVGAAAVAPALTAGAVGLVAFGAGLALVGVGVLAASAGMALFASQLPNIVAYGSMAATNIVKLSGAMLTYSASALASGASSTVLGAGLLVMGAGALVAAAGLTALAAGGTLAAGALALSGASSLIIKASLPIIATSALTASAGLMALAASTGLFGAAALIAGPASVVMAGGLVAGTAGITAFGVAAAAAAVGIKLVQGPLTALGTASASLGTGLAAGAGAVVLLTSGIKASNASIKGFNTLLADMSTGIKNVDTSATTLTNNIRTEDMALKAIASTARATMTAMHAEITQNIKQLSQHINEAGNGAMTIITGLMASSTAATVLLVANMTTAGAQATATAAKIRTAFASLSSSSYGWGADMMQGFIDGVNSKKEDLSATIDDVAGSVSSKLHFSRPDEGPLRDYETWMPDFMHGMAQGINDNLPIIDDAAANVAKSLQIGAKAPQIKSAQGAGANQTASASSEANATVLREILELLKDQQRDDKNGPQIAQIILDGRIIEEYQMRARGRKLVRSGGMATT